jgi:hypothetical protein
MPVMAGSNWRQALDRTRRAAMGRLAQVLGTSEIDDQTWEGIETGLMQADVGAALSAEIVQSLRTKASSQGLTRNDELRSALRTSLVQQFVAPVEGRFPVSRPLVYVLVGVNDPKDHLGCQAGCIPAAPGSNCPVRRCRHLSRGSGRAAAALGNTPEGRDDLR